MNPSATDNEILDQWKREPAPLLAVLHAFHDRDGHLSEPVIRKIADSLKIPLAELYGTITFYHHLAQEPPGQLAPRVCAGPVCCLKGSGRLLSSLPNASAMACAGRCDDPIPVLKGRRVLTGSVDGSLAESPSPLPAPNPGNAQECVFAKIREPNRAAISGYIRGGGYAALEQVLSSQTPPEVIELISKSRLAGRGGAGFPTGAKWKAVADAPGEPKTIVCNADEG